MLNEGAAVVVRGKVVVPACDYRATACGGKIEGVGRAGGGKPDVAICVNGDMAVGLAVKIKQPRESISDARLVAIGVVVFGGWSFGTTGGCTVPGSRYFREIIETISCGKSRCQSAQQYAYQQETK